MKTKVLALMAIATITIIGISCDNQRTVVDLHETSIVDTTLRRGIPMQEFYKKSIEEKKAFIELYKMELTYNVWDNSYVKDPKNITFVIGSGTASNLQGNDKKFYDTKFNDELIVITTGLGDTPDTTFVFNGVRCSPILTEKIEVGHGATWKFEIKNHNLGDFINTIEKWDSLKIESSYSMPGLQKGDKFAPFLKENERYLYDGDIIDCFDRRVIDPVKHDVANFKKRERLKKR
jgi:hypothetical protein